MRFDFSAIVKAGLISGVAAGLFLSAFLFIIVEPIIDEALTYETPPPGEEGPPIVERDVQRTFPVAGAVLAGVASALPFGLVFSPLFRWLPGNSSVKKALVLAIISFVVLQFIPFFKYPAQPPGVASAFDDAFGGSQNSIYFRQQIRFAFQMSALFGFIASSLTVYGVQKRRGEKISLSTRIPIQIAIFLAFVLTAFLLLPNDVGIGRVPQELRLAFQVSGLVGSLFFWIILGILFGKLWTKFAKIDAPQQPPRMM